MILQRIVLFLVSKYSLTTDGSSACFNLNPMNPVCPDPRHTFLKCFGRKKPLGTGAKASSMWSTLTLILLPGDKIRCTIFCRNRNNKNVIAENCDSRLFKFETLKGVVKDFEVGEESSFHFFYESSSDKNVSMEGVVEDTLRVFYDPMLSIGKEIIQDGSVKITYPPLVGTKSVLFCPFTYIKFRSKINCKVFPRQSKGKVVLASPFEFDISLTEDSKPEYGDFAVNSFLAISTDEKDSSLQFSFDAGIKEGCNYIQAKIGAEIPNYAEVGNQITNSPFKVCTVGGNEVILRGLTIYILPLVALAIIHVVYTIFQN